MLPNEKPLPVDTFTIQSENFKTTMYIVKAGGWGGGGGGAAVERGTNDSVSRSKTIINSVI